MDRLFSTVRIAWRSLVHRRGTSALVVATIGLGIGLAVSAYAIVDALLLRPFPYPEPDRLVRIVTRSTRGGGEARGVSLEDLRDWRAQHKSLSGLAAYIQFDNNLTDGGTTRAVKMTFANASLFSVLRVAPHLGRTYKEAEDMEGGPVRQLLLSYELWQSQFGGAPSVLGRTVRLRGDSYTVIGVMPAGFRYPDRSDVWVPLMARYASYTFKFPFWRPRDARLHQVVARLSPGMSLDQARADFARVSQSLASSYPDTNQDIVASIQSLRDAEAGNLRPYVLLLMGASLCVLLIAGLNVSSLLLARAASRERETAIHSALGANAGQIVARLLTESLLLSAGGGVLGTALAFLVTGALPQWLPDDLPAWIRFEVSTPVLVFAGALALGSGVLFGLAPALRLVRGDLYPRLKDGTRGSAGGGLRPLSVLVAAEIAFSLLLLIGAGLLVRSFVHLQRQDTGLQTDHLLAVRTSRFVSGKPYTELAVVYGADHREFERRFSELPGVRAAGGSYYVPMEQQVRERAQAQLFVRGQDRREQERQFPAVGTDVTPGFFDALGIPLVEGRVFTEADGIEAKKVAVVSQSAAETLWPGQNPIGQQLRWGKSSDENDWLRVVGVVRDTRWSSFEAGRNLEIYTCSRQWGVLAMTFFLRYQGSADALLPEVRRIVRDVSPDTAVVYARPYPDIISDSIWQPRVWSVALGGFALFAAGLAALGLFGVLNYLVAQRTREIGIRLAIGARPRDVLGLILGHGMKWAALGGTVGLVTAVAFARQLDHLLHGMTAHDPATYVGVTAATLLTAALAALLPAWRAARVDPNVTLRSE